MKLPKIIKNNSKIILIVFLIVVVLVNISNKSQASPSTKVSESNVISMDKTKIAALTDEWITQVTVAHNPRDIVNLFCADGTLVGTVSQVIRRGNDIRRYFDYFAKLPDIKVVAKKYDIVKVTDNVFINTAFIKWLWKGLDKPITARMTFIYRNKCIMQLHSSALPDLNSDLLKVSGLV